MSVARVRCVLVPTPAGKRLRLIDVGVLLRLLKEGKAVQRGQALWEILDSSAAPTPKAQTAQRPVQASSQPPAAPTGAAHPHTSGQKRKHGSKTK